jgi:alpha-ketoglutarate-dependent taurine dioxygenase
MVMRGLETTPLKPLIGSEVRAHVAALTGGAFAQELRALLVDRGVLVFRDLDITLDEQRTITATLGRVRSDEAEGGLQKVTIDPRVSPEYAAYFASTFFWHLDGHHGQTVPCFGASMRPAHLSDTGGETEFLNAYAAYESLNQDERALVDTLEVVHSRLVSSYFAKPDAPIEEIAAWASVPTAVQPLVWQHADGRKSLILGGSVSHVAGMHPADSYDLLVRLRGHMARGEYVYRHSWRPNDLVLWNNTGTLHRARPFDERSGRLLHRFTLEGEEPIRAPSRKPVAAKG